MKNIAEYITKILSSRTILFNLVMGIIAVLGAFGLAMPDAAYVDELFASVWAIGNVILRFMTVAPVGSSPAAKDAAKVAAKTVDGPTSVV